MLAMPAICGSVLEYLEEEKRWRTAGSTASDVTFVERQAPPCIKIIQTGVSDGSEEGFEMGMWISRV